MTTTLITKVDKTADLQKALAGLTKQRVMVGVPADEDHRDDGTFGNAAIGYLNEFGSPLQNIPPRPHLIPGVERVADRITKIFENGGRAALSGDKAAADAALDAAGQVAVSSVRRMISEGLSPALADSTVEARARRGRKGAIQEMANRASGKDPSSDLTKPLQDTGEYRNSITYVKRDV